MKDEHNIISDSKDDVKDDNKESKEELKSNESMSSPTNGTNKKSKNITWQQPVTVGSPANESTPVVVVEDVVVEDE